MKIILFNKRTRPTKNFAEMQTLDHFISRRRLFCQ